MRRAALVALLALLPAAAQAGKGAIDIEHFHSQISGRGLFTAEAAETHHQWHWGLGLVLQYARDPLVLSRSGVKAEDVVSDRLTGNVLLSLGLLRWLEVGALLPVALANEANPALAGATTSISGLGSLRLQLKARLLSEGRNGIGLSVLGVVSLPTGNHNAFLGQNFATFSPALLVEKHLGPVRLLANLGYIAREDATYLNLRIDDELFWRFGLGLRLHDTVELGGELIGTTSASDPFSGDVRRNPLEVLFGSRFLLTDRLQLQVGAGTGVSRGYGTPSLRVFAGLVFAPHELDTDGDGVPDRRDRCPTVQGPRANAGCPWPDTDNDGVTDNADDCPKVAGPRENRGCPWPDTDNDGVFDKDDRCPKVPGPKANRGCPWPDTDKDGILDKDDRCPKVPGPKANRGCPWPDTDKDGILDKDDRCPKVPGPKANRGCPWPDTDKDGILDKDDRCPKVPGPRANRGCPWPDTDKDGVLDKDDDCPTQPGPKSNHGCPKAPVVVTRFEVRISEKVFFRTGSARIQRRSHFILNEVAKVLKRYRRIKQVEVQGHTDDVGREKYNLALSQRRARSVRTYLIRKGVAGSRLVAKGYGESKPLAPLRKGMSRGQKREARALNRRVQFIILKQ